MGYVLIIFLATSAYSGAGASGVAVPFASEALCLKAGNALAKDAEKRGNFVLTYGCFKQ